MRRLILVSGLLLAAACSRAAPSFSIENAQAHIRMLAGTIGSRPIGTDANRRAREYLVDRLREYGFAVRVQEADAERRATTARVANIIATRPGRRAQAITLVAHYDSVPDGPGAADDALGVAVCVEAGRVLARRAQPNYALAVILTDGEEIGLMGATAVMKDPIAGWMRAVLNFEAVGSGGPAVLFETGPGSRAAIDAWAARAPRPAGASYMTDIYRMMPNGTDFTVFARAHLPGLNFASAGDGYAYHTTRDTPDRLPADVVAQMGENALATVAALDEAEDLSDRTDARTTYLDVAHRWAVAYGTKTALILSAASLLAALFAWLTVLSGAREVERESVVGSGLPAYARHRASELRRGPAEAAPERSGSGGGQAGTTPRLLLTALWSLVGLVAVFGAMVGATWLLRATRESYQPWYAHPDRFFVYLVLAGALGGWVVLRVGRLLPTGLRGSTQPAVIWAIILPFWFAIVVAAQIVAPSAAYLAVLPLLAAGISLAVLPIRSATGARVASALVLLVAGILWATDGLVLLHTAVTTFGYVPAVTPLYVFPGLLVGLGVFIVPPLLALVSGLARASNPPEGGSHGRSASLSRADVGSGFSRISAYLPGSRLLIALFVFAAAWCWFAPAYVDARPLRASICYFNDTEAGRARWQMASNEPDIHIGVTAPVGGAWEPGAPPRSFGVPMRLPLGPFIFYAPTDVVETPPVTVTGSLKHDENGSSIEITAVPREPALAVEFNLPDGVMPEETNLAGQQREGAAFFARYAALPPEGVTLRARIGSGDAAKLQAGGTDARVRVLVMRSGLPGAAWPKLPSWLPQEHTAWQARSYFVVPVPIVAQ